VSSSRASVAPESSPAEGESEQAATRTAKTRACARPRARLIGYSELERSNGSESIGEPETTSQRMGASQGRSPCSAMPGRMKGSVVASRKRECSWASGRSEEVVRAEWLVVRARVLSARTRSGRSRRVAHSSEFRRSPCLVCYGGLRPRRTFSTPASNPPPTRLIRTVLNRLRTHRPRRAASPRHALPSTRRTENRARRRLRPGSSPRRVDAPFDGRPQARR
jgi:hypothetical protein